MELVHTSTEEHKKMPKKKKMNGEKALYSIVLAPSYSKERYILEI